MKGGSPPAIAVDRLARELFDAEALRRPIEPLTARHPSLGLADAYRIQRINIERRLEGGERIIGHKIGLTAKAMQEKFGVNEPDYGHLLDTMLLREGEPLDMSELIDPQIEVEPAFVLGADLAGPGVSVADVLDATEYVCMCFEVIDSRITDWRIRLQDTVADNGSSSRLVLGTDRIGPHEARLDELDTELELDGEVVETGNTRDILGHPANGIAWLANTLADYGVTLSAGHIVLPGTCTRSRRIGRAREACGRIARLGEVRLELRGRPFATSTEP